jgi:phage terminase large subunit-like protein
MAHFFHAPKIRRLVELHQKEHLRRFDWSIQARPEQRLPEGDWKIWIILAGRGFGKTRTGAETVRQWVQQKTYQRICLLGDHHDDVRQVMIEGASGLMSVSPPWEGVQYEPSLRHVKWPCGAVAVGYSAHTPQQLRGPQFDAAWVDELAKFDKGSTAWDQLMMGLRLGTHPRVIITTTPKASPLLSQVLSLPDVIVTRGTTWDNADNLSNSFLDTMKRQYHNTRLGTQELEGQILQDLGGGLWSQDLITYGPPPTDLHRMVIAIDPAASTHATSAETGIIVAGCDRNGMGYVLEDGSGLYSPAQWAEKTAQLFYRYQADRVIAEINHGGDMVRHVLHSHDPQIPLETVHATRGKHLRAEPIVALYEQRRIRHQGYFHDLESQMTGVGSPGSAKRSDRLDALVWALYALFFHRRCADPTIAMSILS